MIAPRMRSHRLALTLVGVVFYLLRALPASAQSNNTINVGSLQMKLAQKDSAGTVQYMNKMDAQEFFNSANCTCNSTYYVRSTLVNAPSGNLGNSVVQFWLGPGCNTNDLTQRAMICTHYSQADKAIN